MASTGLELTVQFPKSTIVKKVQRAFPGWKVSGIADVSYNGVNWNHLPDRCERTEPLSRLSHYASKGFKMVSFRLDHPNGVGEAYPDYFIDEFAEEFRWKPFDRLQIHANQGWRDAYVLAVVGDEALIEYEMPAGSTALWVISANDPRVTKLRNVAYANCPNKWLAAITDACVVWENRGQGRPYIDKRDKG